jgi:hypothetical protein
MPDFLQLARLQMGISAAVLWPEVSLRFSG